MALWPMCPLLQAQLGAQNLHAFVAIARVHRVTLDVCAAPCAVRDWNPVVLRVQEVGRER